MRFIESLISIVTPNNCLACDSEGSLFCSQCIGLITEVMPQCGWCSRPSNDFKTCTKCRKEFPLDFVYILTDYSGPIRDLIRSAKFSHNREASRIISGLVAEIDVKNTDLIVSVPTAPRHIRTRSYDHVALMARSLSRANLVAFKPVLLRVGFKRQVGSRRTDRIMNQQDAFYAKPDSVRGLNVLLIDDLITSGGTLRGCARALKKAGAKSVSAVVFAKHIS